MNNPRILTSKNEKSSGYYFYMNLNIWGDFQICISVPLNWHFWIFEPNYPKKGISSLKQKSELLWESMVVTHYIKLYCMGVDRQNDILMSVLLPVAETIKILFRATCLTHWLPMTSILVIIGRISWQQFKCNYLRNQKLFLFKFSLHFLNLHRILNILKKKDEPHSLIISENNDSKIRG